MKVSVRMLAHNHEASFAGRNPALSYANSLICDLVKNFPERLVAVVEQKPVPSLSAPPSPKQSIQIASGPPLRFASGEDEECSMQKAEDDDGSPGNVEAPPKMF